MDENVWLAERFEEHRARLHGVAYRMLGSLTEADDAVQDAWLRLSRSEASEIENLGGWLMTVVARLPEHAAHAQRPTRGIPRCARARPRHQPGRRAPTRGRSV